MICNICKKKVHREEFQTWGGWYSVNAAIVGTYLGIKGHQTCLESVDRQVVIPNRLRLREEEAERNIQDAVEEMESWKMEK